MARRRGTNWDKRQHLEKGTHNQRIHQFKEAGREHRKLHPMPPKVSRAGLSAMLAEAAANTAKDEEERA